MSHKVLQKPPVIGTFLASTSSDLWHVHQHSVGDVRRQKVQIFEVILAVIIKVTV